MNNYRYSLEKFSNLSIEVFDNPLIDHARFENIAKSPALSVGELVELFLEYRERVGRKSSKRNEIEAPDEELQGGGGGPARRRQN